MNRNKADREPSFSIFEFKSWFARQPDSEFKLPDPFANRKPQIKDDMVGQVVESRLGLQRLEGQIAKHNAELDASNVSQMAQTFKESGGKVIEVGELYLMVETAQGKFSLPRLYIKIKD